MGLTVNLLNRIALSNIGTRFYKWSASSKGQAFLTQRLPGIETIVASSLYIASTRYQGYKGNIDPRRESLLQSQNVLSGVVGYVLGSWASKKSTNYINNKIIPDLNPRIIPDIHKVKLGLQVFLPIFFTALAVRGLIPACLAWVSGKIEEYKASRHKPINTWDKVDTGKYFNKLV